MNLGKRRAEAANRKKYSIVRIGRKPYAVLRVTLTHRCNHPAQEKEISHTRWGCAVSPASWPGELCPTASSGAH